MRYCRILLIAAIALFALSPEVSADYRESFKKEFLQMPWAGGPAEVSACVDCHTSDQMREDYRDIPEQWRKSWHYRNDVSCHDCHGGNKDDETMPDFHLRDCAGAPEPVNVPKLCGRCHVGILENYLMSGHAKTLKATGEAPSCVTCHGSHNIQKASISIISEQLCSRCHSYERAKQIKQALFSTEKQIAEIESGLSILKESGVLNAKAERSFFSTQVEFRALFHATDVGLISDRTEEFVQRLGALRSEIDESFEALRFRRNFSAFILLIIVGLGVTLWLLSESYRE